MFPIKEARFLAPDIKLLKIEAARIAQKRKAGQFVIVRVHDHGERIPLTIADSDAQAGTITIIVQGVGKTTKLINMLRCRRRSARCRRAAGQCVRCSQVRNRRRDRRRCRHGDRLPDRGRHEAGRQSRA